MKIRKGTILNMGRDNEPVPGCTVSESIYDDGRQAITLFSLEMMRGMKFKQKKAAAFGSYGWGGEAVKMITARLAEAGFEVINDGKRSQWVPDEQELQSLRLYGRELAGQL